MITRADREATEEAWKRHRRERKREITRADAKASATGKMFASEFARLHGVNPYVLRRRMRKAGYDRDGVGRVPIKDLERFLPGRR